ncbi:MAG: efflux RND transporter permease subunit [Deltaproteobacteria bacterium]|nr:efflux RND transporter permease subunit [Deltaproteobacteria bacterium]
MIAFFVRNRATVLMLVVTTFVFGLTTYRDMPREAAPDVEIPVVMVSTPYVGVSPEDIESIVTIPIENELTGLRDLKKMSSTSAEGVSIIALEFEPKTVIEDALQRTRDRVNRARAKLPQDAEETDIREISFSDFPIMILTIAGPVDEEVLKKLGERLEDEAKRVPGVLEARLSGGRTREIRVQVDAVRISHYGLTLHDVVDAIGSENVNVPGGEVEAGATSFLVRVPGEFTDPREIEGVAIKRVGDRPVFVRDVARVVDGFADRDTYARMNGQPAVSLAISKRVGSNILDVADAVKALVARHARSWPRGVTYRVLGDQSRFIVDIVSDLENNILTALILVVGVLLVAMGLRASLFVALTIPLAMFLTYIVLWGLGITLNMVVLFSLILTLGMLVDNGIVLVENIYRHAQEGEDLTTASIGGAKEVAMAVTSSTVTTVVAFVPLLFWTGIMGEFMSYLPRTVIIGLTASLLSAVLVMPVATARYMKVRPRPPEVAYQGRFMRGYRAVLEWSIRHRWLSALVGLVALIGTVLAYARFNHGTEFFPSVEPNRATVTVRAADGTGLEATDAFVRRIEAILAREPNVDVFVAETGISGGGNPIEGSQSAPNQARLTVDFLPDHNTAGPGEKIRVESTFLTLDRIRDAVEKIAGAEIAVEEERMGPPVGAPVVVEVSGEGFHEVGALAARVRRQLAGVEGVTELGDDYRVGRPELRLRIDRGAAKRVGASTREVAAAVRTAIASGKASTLRDGEEEYDIVVELDPRDRRNIQAILNLRIPGREDTSPDSFAVPLSAVARYELGGGSGSIRHVDQKLVVTIEGNVEEGQNENAVRERVQEHIARTAVPAGYALRLGGADDEQRESQEFLSRAFLVAIFLIAIVLVAQFNRFDIPLIILGSVVLSLIGVLWGLVVTGTSFGIVMTGLGVISLAGVVVNNAIVLLDYVEKLRARGLDVEEALVKAGITRLRPVLLTAVTTILGLVPMAVGTSYDFAKLRWITGSQGAAWWGPMAIAVIFGLGFATVLTLVMVPTLYRIAEDLRAARARVKSALARLVRRTPHSA